MDQDPAARGIEATKHQPAVSERQLRILGDLAPATTDRAVNFDPTLSMKT